MSRASPSANWTRVSLGVLSLLTQLLASPLHAAPPRDNPSAAPRQPIDDRLVLTRVVPDDNRVAARLGAELDVIGLEAEWIDIAANAPPIGPDLIEQVTAAGASAAIEIVMGDNRIEVWVADANTGKTLTRRFDLALDPAQAEPRTLAIAAVELLRASRLELAGQGEAKPSGPSEQVSEDERAPVAERGDSGIPLRGALSLAPVLGGSPGGFGFTPQLEVAGRWAPPQRRYGLRVSAWVPTIGNRISTENGAARVLMAMAFVEPQLRLPGGAPWFHPELGLGLGAAITIIQGETTNDSTKAEQVVLAGFAGHGHVGLGFELTPRFWLRLDGYGGIIQPYPVITFQPDINSDEVEVAGYWGLPFGMGSLGAEVWF